MNGAIAAVAVIMIVWLLACWNLREHRYDNIIRTAASRHRIAPELVKAVVWRESRFNPRARGRAGEIGLMQLTDVAAHEWAAAERRSSFDHEEVLDPATNADAGCYYLAKALKRYGNTDHPYVYALADYNAGRGNVLRWMKESATTNSSRFLARMDFPGTRDYVLAILDRSHRYRGDFR